jgi:AraC-like DNA-binding protein
MTGFKRFFTLVNPHSSPVYVRGIGVREAMPPGVINRPRGTGDHLLMYFHDPVWAAASELPAQQPAGTFMIWTPGRWQYYGSPDHPFCHSWIHCDGPIVRHLLRDCALPLDTPLLVGDAAIIETPLLAIHEELAQQHPGDTIILRNLLENLLRGVARKVLHSPEGQIPQTLLEIRRLIESEYDKPLPLKELAARAGLSVSRFCEVFHEHFGSGAHEYLLQHRLQQAAYLLRDQNMAVKEVARRVGYRDAYAFSKLFKKRYRANPTAFRRQEPRPGRA